MNYVLVGGQSSTAEKSCFEYKGRRKGKTKQKKMNINRRKFIFKERGKSLEPDYFTVTFYQTI